MADERDLTVLLANARAGDAKSKAKLLSYFREYLRLLAHLHVKPLFKAKFDESDLVQETFMRATIAFDQFQGEDEKQFAAWLRQIMANKGAELARKYLTQKRDAQLEVQLQNNFDKSSVDLANVVAVCHSTPSHAMMHREQSVRLADAIASIRGDQREVLILHGLQGKSVPEVAKSMGRTEASTWKLWARGLQELRRIMGDTP